MAKLNRACAGAGAVGLMLFAGALAPACLTRPLERIEPKTSGRYESTLTQSRVDKIDIILTIDDSGSMADKQAILASAVPQLVTALANPPCVDDEGATVATPAGPLLACPEGLFREFEPVLDIHIGILSSTLGDAGAPQGCIETLNDHAHFVKRIDPSDPTVDAETFDDLGFLVWRPEEGAAAPGQFDDITALGDQLELMITGVGQTGCGYEAQLESWYRFLVDPRPYGSLEYDEDRRSALKTDPNVLAGLDETLMAQRRAFLRPDSLVAIVMLSDENDCSMRHDGHGWLTAAPTLLDDLRARSECAVDPNDPCCAPCEKAPKSCPADPVCDAPLPPGHGLSNLTCFKQKQRFGIDFLYPTARYVDGLTKTEIADRDGDLVPNPLFVSEDGTLRPNDRVFFAGIVGLPWQTVARNPDDIGEGLQSAREMVDNGTWKELLPDPETGAPPTDPHMIETTDLREGLPGPDSGYLADPVHGHDYVSHLEKQDGSTPLGLLQHACIFPLAEPVDCNGSAGCDCDTDVNASQNPLCQQPDGSYSSTHQYFAKAYPSTRQLEVLRGIGEQAIVASICPAEPIDESSPHYGYLPAIEALVERLKQTLKGPCLSRSLTADSDRQVACIILEGRATGADESCSCDGLGRREVRPEYQNAVTQALEHPSASYYQADCFCEIEQLRSEALTACQDQLAKEPLVNGEPVHGWCYIDHDGYPTVGNQALVDHCESGERRTIRFVGEGEPETGALAFVTCQPESN